MSQAGLVPLIAQWFAPRGEAAAEPSAERPVANREEAPTPDLERPPPQDPVERPPPQDVPGLIEPGNIDRRNRPVVFNPDGSFSTERSFSVNLDGREVLLPLIVNGREVTPEEAIQHHRRTGEHLGMFKTPADADAYANQTHGELEQYYLEKLRRASTPRPLTPPTPVPTTKGTR